MSTVEMPNLELMVSGINPKVVQEGSGGTMENIGEENGGKVSNIDKLEQEERILEDKHNVEVEKERVDPRIIGVGMKMWKRMARSNGVVLGQNMPGSKVTDIVLDFLNNDTFDPEINTTRIVLIPKTKDPSDMTQFRPISLNAMVETWCNFDLGMDIDDGATVRFWKRLYLHHMWVVAKYDYSSRLYHANILEWLVVEAGEWRDEQLVALAVALYHTWERRNKKKFENEVVRVETLWPRVEKIMDEVQTATFCDDRNNTVPTNLRWEKPEYPFIKLNVDAAVIKDGGGSIGGGGGAVA
ncbi:putative ribonuclease H protein [Senna tora]|uniref:Putative ribonuclease H protein n=1 Tax=Senna tora TaxID=362788 RepID=A0A834X7D0_9FABA|nr:putative ribonuclease H protein [Senna tora]